MLIPSSRHPKNINISGTIEKLLKVAYFNPSENMNPTYNASDHGHHKGSASLGNS